MDGDGPIIQTQELTRTYGESVAVDSVDLSILPGEIFGLVGPDGAGKTTTLRLMAGLLKVSAGSAQVAGYDLARQAEAIKPRIGYMAQQFSLYADLSVWENLIFFADLYRVAGEVREGRIQRLLEFARLSRFQDRRAGKLSGGMQKKLSLACTLIHQPQILLLDEPTTGVDPVSRREFWEILTELHLAGTTIVVSTPYMDEAERCQRIALMYAGRVVLCDSPRAIQSRVEGELIEFHPEDWRSARRVVEALPGVLEVQTYGNSIRLFLDSAERRWPVIKRALEKSQIRYSSVRLAPARMEDAFVSLIRRMGA